MDYPKQSSLKNLLKKSNGLENDGGYLYGTSYELLPNGMAQRRAAGRDLQG